MSTRYMRRRMFKDVCPLAMSALAAGILFAYSGTAAAIDGFGGFADFCDPGDYDNTYLPPPLGPHSGQFTDLRRGAQINADYDACVLNLSGSVGSAGDMWITVVDGVEGASNCVSVGANILIKRFDNRKGVGVVTNYAPFPFASGTGLFFGVYDAGNTDSLTISQFNAATGQLTIPPVATLPLGSKIKENHWYRLQVRSCNDGVNFWDGSGAMVFDLEYPFGPLIPAPLSIDGKALGSIPSFGRVGIAGHAKSSFVDSSVTNFSWGFGFD